MNLTLPQQDIYFEQLLYPDYPIYNIGAKISIRGSLDYATLNKAYCQLIIQHDAYRSVLKQEEDSIRVEFKEFDDLQLGWEDFSNEKNPDDIALSYMQSRFRECFDLTSQCPLYNFILIRVNKDFHYLFSVYHHIITDGWGTSLMFQRLVANYNELLEQGEIKSEYPYTYSKFVEDDIKYQSSEAYQKDKAYWKQKYSTLPHLLLEKKSKEPPLPESNRKELVISRTTYNKLVDMAQENRSTTFHIILGILYLYLGRRFQQTDLTIGVPVLNRSSHYFKKTVGLFMGVTALRINIDYNSTFRELLSQINQQLRQDYRHQRFPFGKLVQELPLDKKDPRLFDITLSYEKQDYAHTFANTETRVIPLSHGAERVPLAIYIREFDDNEDVKIDFDYNIHYLDHELIHEVAGHFESLVKEVSNSCDKKLLNYNYLTDAERSLILHTYNATDAALPENHTLLDYFEKQVAERPDQIALYDQEISYTYLQLNQLSDSIAHYLRYKAGVEQGSAIAVLLPRCPFLIAGIMGIFKAGCKYIPIDPTFPPDRISYMIQHSGVRYAIGTPDVKNLVPDSVQLLPSEVLSEYNFDGNYTPSLKGSESAYIIYTSGSTGVPKGVQIKHLSLLNFMLGIQKELKLSEGEVLFSVTTPSFDISILEFFLPLLTGGTVYVASPDILNDHIRLIEEIEKVQPHTIQATPSFYMLLINAGWEATPGLRVLCGGEPLITPVVNKLARQCSELYNMYGPTETTIWSSCKLINPDSSVSNVGKPIHNTQVYVLDKFMQPLPRETFGNIYIGGHGVAEGYYNDDELTNQRFLPNPFKEVGRIYHTGDVGKWSFDGEILFKGRSDNQVKIRGYRIELNEIEIHLEKLDAVNAAVVIAKKNQQQEAFLVAYVILKEIVYPIEAIKKALRKSLPPYMVPDIFVSLDAFPLTPNKKTDRKALQNMEVGEGQKQEQTQLRPATEIEAQLCDCYQNVLALDRNVGTEEDFFAIGGHSLNAVRLAGAIQRQLNLSVSLKVLFENSTVATLAGYLQKNRQLEKITVSALPGQSYYPISNAQYPIWLACMQREKNAAYNMFSAFNVSGQINHPLLSEAFEYVIAKYETLRTNFAEADGIPRQKIIPPAHIDFRLDSYSTDEADYIPLLEAYANKVFDLEKDLLIKVAIFDTPEGAVMLVVTHHIIMDGWSLEILIKEVVDNYKALATGNDLPDQTLAIQYKDFVAWQLKHEAEKEPVNRSFWAKYMKGYEWKPLLSYDSNLSLQGSGGAFYFFDFGQDILNRLQAFSAEHKVTLHTLLVSTFQIIVHHVQELNDISIGTINSGRPYAELHGQIGMFVKTLPLRRKVDSSITVLELLNHNQSDLLQIDVHQDVPDDISGTFRYEAIIVLQNQSFDYKNINISDRLSLKTLPINAMYNRLPMLLDFSVNRQNLQGSVHYDTSKYEADTISIFMLQFEAVLDQIISSPTLRVQDISTDLTLETEDNLDIDFSF